MSWAQLGSSSQRKETGFNSVDTVGLPRPASNAEIDRSQAEGGIHRNWLALALQSY